MSFFAFTIVAMVGVVVQPSAARSPPRLTALARQPPIKMQQLQMEEHRSSTPAVSALSQQMTDASARLKADEQASVMIQALRGTNLNDDNAAAAGTRMQVVEMSRGVGQDVLPTTYQPEQLAAYFKKRPLAVAQRIAQVFFTSGGWLAGVSFSGVVQAR